MTDVGGIPMIQSGNDGFSGLVALFAIMALFGGGGGGFFGGNRGNGEGDRVTEKQLDMMNTNFDTRLNSIQGQMDFNGVNTQLSAIQGEVGRLGRDNALIAKDTEITLLKGQCETNRNIDGVRTQMAQDTCAIITNQNSLAKDAELRAAYAKIAEQGQIISEERITSTLKGFIMEHLVPPRAVPAYAASHPYENFVPTVRLAGNGGRFDNC